MMLMPVQNISPPLDKKHAELQKATQQFESYFLDTLLKEMRKTVQKSELLKDDGNQEQIFQEMLDQRFADSMSQRGDFGLGKQMYDTLSPAIDRQAALDAQRGKK